METKRDLVKCVVDVLETPAVLQEKLKKEAEARKKQADIISEERSRRYEQICVIDSLRKELEQIKKERDAAMKFIPKDVKCGKWVETYRKNIWGDSTSVFACSACGRYTVGKKGITIKSRYCPNCGAFMQEE